MPRKPDVLIELENYLDRCDDVEKMEVLKELASILPYYGLSLKCLEQFLPDQIQEATV